MKSDCWSRLSDIVERVVLVGLLGLLTYRMVPHLADKPGTIIYVISEALVVVMIAFRRPANRITLRPADWFIGFGGTFLPLVVTPGSSSGFAYAGLLLLLGFGITLSAQLSLRRSFGVVAANRGVKTAGPYGIVRHPMYVGYFLTYLGFLLTYPTAWNAAVYVTWTACQLHRIHAEERVLSADLAYVAFARRIRYRLLPFVY